MAADGSRESERFDRVGSHGRRGVPTLPAIDAERVTPLDAFGALIGNTDRQLGNVSVFDRREGRFDLAPVYDMPARVSGASGPLPRARGTHDVRAGLYFSMTTPR